jgi:hypothetical protein
MTIGIREGFPDSASKKDARIAGAFKLKFHPDK